MIPKSLILIAVSAAFCLVSTPPGLHAETIGGGTIDSPAEGPGPSYGIGGGSFVLVKNWNLGTSASSTIKNMADMNAHFQYHDHYNSMIGGGGNYGAKMVASDTANDISGQPVVGVNGVPEVREFQTDSLKTYVVPLNPAATNVTVSAQDAGSGSFQAKWFLPGAGVHLKQDILWEVRLRYNPPKYFWYSHWIDGEVWHKVEIDVIESFGYDNGGGSTNYDGRFWHSAIGLGTSPDDNSREVSYASWINGMNSVGVPNPYDAAQYHTWTMLYRADNTVSMYVDGIEVQRGSLNWTVGGAASAAPMQKVFFLFDATWGHKGISSVNKTMPVSELVGKFFEFDYSRVYLRPAQVVEAEDVQSAVASDPVTLVADAAASGGELEKLESDAVNDYITYTVPGVPSDVSTFLARVKKGTDAGQVQLSVSGGNQGALQELYTAAPGYAHLNLGNRNIPYPGGSKPFKFTILGKNAASSSHKMALDYIQISKFWSKFEAEHFGKVAASDSITNITQAEASAGAWERLNANTVGDYVTYTVPGVKAGTYSVRLRLKKEPTAGQFQLNIDGANFAGIQDQYAATTSWPELNLGNKTFGTNGNKAFKLTVTGKNAASSGYTLSVDRIQLIP